MKDTEKNSVSLALSIWQAGRERERGVECVGEKKRKF